MIAGGVTSWSLLKAVEKTKAFSAVQTVITEGLDRAAAAGWDVARSRLIEQRALFLRQEAPLRRLAKLQGFGWLNRTLDWVKRQPDPGDTR